MKKKLEKQPFVRYFLALYYFSFILRALTYVFLIKETYVFHIKSN